jgi:hypothetical protein
MAKQRSLHFLIRGQAEPLVFTVSEEVPDRVSRILNAENLADEPRFFWFETINGLSVVLNLADVQALRHGGGPGWHSPSRSPDGKAQAARRIQIKLRGREPLDESTRRPEEVFDLFADLEHGPDVAAYPGFLDEDGERIQLNPHDVVWVAAPTSMLREGERKSAQDTAEAVPA